MLSLLASLAPSTDPVPCAFCTSAAVGIFGPPPPPCRPRSPSAASVATIAATTGKAQRAQLGEDLGRAGSGIGRAARDRIGDRLGRVLIVSSTIALIELASWMA
jgi:hypothetical protein